MSTRRTLRTAFVSAALVWTASAWAAPDRGDLAWIGRLPGLSLLTNRTTSNTTKTVYSVSGNVERTVERVADGLTERGWTIRKSTSAPVGGIVARSLTAERDGARLKVSASDVMGVSHLTLTLRGGGRAASQAAAEEDAEEDEEDAAEPAQAAAPPARSSETAPASAPAPVPPSAPARASGPLALIDNRLEGRYDCDGRDVTIGGDRCRITLEGACRSLEVLGNSNRVFVDGSVQAIRTLGERNEITWSAAKNPRPPRITTLGGRNRVEPDERQ